VWIFNTSTKLHRDCEKCGCISLTASTWTPELHSLHLLRKSSRLCHDPYSWMIKQESVKWNTKKQTCLLPLSRKSMLTDTRILTWKITQYKGRWMHRLCISFQGYEQQRALSLYFTSKEIILFLFYIYVYKAVLNHIISFWLQHFRMATVMAWLISVYYYTFRYIPA
jgi:hypothetical protein